MNRRVKKKVKRKIKTWVKISTLGFVFLVISGLLIYGWYQKKLNEEDPTGTVVEIEEQGSITEMPDEEGLPVPLEYIVLDTEGESILVNYGELEILVDAPEGALSRIKERVDGEIEYVVLTSARPIRTQGLSEISETFTIKNIIGGSLDGATELPSGETVVLGDRFSLTTIETDRGLATYLIYKDAGFLALGDLSPDDEYLISKDIRNVDVVVAAMFGSSDNNRIIQNKKPRYIAVSQKDFGLIHENLFMSADKNPVYATGKTGDLLFSTTGQVVTAAFDVKDFLTSESILKLKQEETKAENESVEEGKEEGKEEDGN